jgi:hypothetical protein
MALPDRLLDEATAIAKGRSHAAVEPRHVLAAILRVLGPAAVPDVDPAELRGWLSPAGKALEPPTITPEAQAALERCTANDAALAEARSIATWLRERGRVDGPASPPGGAGAEGAAAGVEVETASAAQASPSTTAPGPSPAATVAELLAELDALVGLAEVKADVRKLVAVQRLNAERRARSLPEVAGSAHLVFTGEPGTGKTTVARIVARLYGAIGVVSKGHLVEATRADLVAGYVGQTALKVQDVVRKAIGGALFIDEAYALAQGGDEDFGAEAIATLVKLMEDNRRDLVVIVAGYRDEMWTFIRSNPGLRSRFTRYIDFPDYSVGELLLIFDTMAARAKVRVEPGARDLIRELLDDAVGIEHFGNARFVRSVFEQAYANMAGRAVLDDRIDPEELDQMTADDLRPVHVPVGTEHRTIGFRPA